MVYTRGAAFRQPNRKYLRCKRCNSNRCNFYEEIIMDKPGKLTLTLIALVLTPVLALAQERVGDFALIDQNGTQHELSG